MSTFDVEAFLEEQQSIAANRKAEEQVDGAHSSRHGDSPQSKQTRDHDGTRPRRRELDHYDGRRHGGRASTDRYLSEREENDQRRSRRSRDLVDEVDTRPGSDKGSNKHRSRSPRPNSRRSDDRRYRARSRSRTLSPRRHQRDDRRDRRFERVDDYRPSGRRDRGDRQNGRRGDSYRGSRRSPSGPPRSPEVSEEDRDHRTIFVQQLANRLRNKELKKFFEQVGPVLEAQIVTDRVSGRSKGVGYVEFKDEASVEKALHLTGQKLLEVPIIVSLTEAEKNRQAKLKESTTSRSNTAPQTRLYVGNIQFNITEDDLRSVFAPWGDLVAVVLTKDEHGRSKGYAFIEYTKPEAAKAALEAMNNFMLGERAIRVGLGGDRGAHFSESDKSANTGAGANGFQGAQGSSFSGLGGRGTHAGGTGSYDRANGRDGDKIGGASALDDVDIDNVNFNNFNRNDLMQKLMRQKEPAPSTTPKAEVRKNFVPAPTATRCILLKNMYQEHEWKTGGAAFVKELEEDISSECNSKYGKVVHIALAPENSEGEVYLKFADVTGGTRAYQGLQGRLFAGANITAQYVVDVVYNSLFPKASQV